MRRNLKPARKELRAERTAAGRTPRASSQEVLGPIGDPETLWEEDAEPESSANEDEADDEMHSTRGDPDRPAEEKDADEPTGPDDALGLYLRQMGAIPLLNRQQELDLARRLERARTRYRRAAL